MNNLHAREKTLQEKADQPRPVTKTDSATIAIDARQVDKRFPTVHPVRNATFQIRAGEFVTLLGPSGSGKSTLLGMIAGFEPPTQGEILIQGQSLKPMDEDERALMRRACIGFVFQAFHLIPTLSALENVAFPLYPVDMPPNKRTERARNLLERVGLGHRTGHLPGRLSGGECQRVAIARALVNEPSILLCDEPTGNLDSETGRMILSLLMDLNREKQMTLFLVTHDQDLAQLADRSLIMHDGEVEQS